MSTLSVSASLNAMLALCRVSNLPTVWMNVLTATVLVTAGAGAAGGLTPSHVALFLLQAFAMSCFYCAGMAMNDLCDFEHDSLYQRHRPIPAGRITLRRARQVMLALFTAGLVGLLAAPHDAGFGAGTLLLLVICVYDWFHKRHPSTVLAMAGARLLVYLVTALALTGDVAGIVWLTAALQAAYVLLLTVVARLESHTAQRRYGWPVIPWLIAAMPVLDGAVLAITVHPGWLLAGIACAAMTRAGQRHVRGD